MYFLCLKFTQPSNASICPAEGFPGIWVLKAKHLSQDVSFCQTLLPGSYQGTYQADSPSLVRKHLMKLRTSHPSQVSFALLWLSCQCCPSILPSIVLGRIISVNVVGKGIVMIMPFVCCSFQ